MNIINKVLDKKEFSTSNWKMRRRIIIYTLCYCSILFLSITCYIAFVVWFKGDRTFDQNLINILNGTQSTIGLVAMSVIGTYVFGATWDTVSYRNNISSISSQKSPNVISDEESQTKG